VRKCRATASAGTRRLQPAGSASVGIWPQVLGALQAAGRCGWAEGQTAGRVRAVPASRSRGFMLQFEGFSSRRSARPGAARCHQRIDPGPPPGSAAAAPRIWPAMAAFPDPRRPWPGPPVQGSDLRPAHADSQLVCGPSGSARVQTRQLARKHQAFHQRNFAGQAIGTMHSGLQATFSTA